MSEPLGRDKLGRFIYSDDCIAYQSFYIPVTDAGESVDSSDALFFRYMLPATEIHESALGNHTNYERYFADLGTEDEVIHSAGRICTEDSLYHGLTDCEDFCPFGKWPGGDSCFSAFTEWLSDEATL